MSIKKQSVNKASRKPAGKKRPTAMEIFNALDMRLRSNEKMTQTILKHIDSIDSDIYHKKEQKTSGLTGEKEIAVKALDTLKGKSPDEQKSATGMGVMCERVRTAINVQYESASNIMSGYRSICTQFGPSDGSSREKMEKLLEEISSISAHTVDCNSIWTLTSDLTTITNLVREMSMLLISLTFEVF